MRLRAWVAVALCAGCGKVLGADFDGAIFDPDAGSGGNGAAAGAAGGGAAAGIGGSGGSAGDGGGACTELHVSPAGDDANTGCDRESPKKTLGSALGEARQRAGVQAIKVCAGTYDEHVTFDLSVKLLGGFACDSWTREAGYGFPSFDATNESVIGGTQLPEALLVTTGAGVSALVDGFTIAGSTSANSQDGVALHVELGASATVQHCRILGGSGVSVGGDGTVGLRVDGGATPEIRYNRIDGGTGMTFHDDDVIGPVGRAAVVIDGASPYLHDNQIDGGQAEPDESYTISSAGVVLRDAIGLTESAGRPIARNEIRGGDGKSKDEDGIASVGLLALGKSTFDLVENAIRPGDCLGLADDLRGVHSLATGGVRIVRSRIYGGNLSDPSDSSRGFRVGAWIEHAQSFLAENDMIYGGVPIVGFSGGSPSFALSLADVSGAVIRHSTLYSGPSGFPTVGTALKLDPGALATVVQSSILAADAGWNEPVCLEACASSGVLSRFENNLLLDSGKPLEGVLGSLFGYGYNPGGSCGAWSTFGSVDALTAHLLAACSAQTIGPCAGFAGVKATGNKTLAASCAGDSGCITWPACNSTTSIACLQSVFESWTPQDNGLGTLFGPGWKLKPGVPCAVTQSALVLGVPTDLFGAPRTAAPSMGAHELDGSCQ